MLTRPTTASPVPFRALAILAVVALGVAVGIVAVRWDNGGSSNEVTTQRSLAPSFGAEPLAGDAALQAAIELHEALTTNVFGPLIRSTVPYHEVESALREHENAIDATVGPYALESSVSEFPERTPEQLIADAIAQHEASLPPYMGW